MFSIYDGRDRFYQWDTGRKLIVEDETITQVHFANCLCPDATVCEVSNGLVNVPDELLTQYMDIRVWGYDGEMTKYEQVIEVEKRTKPSDYIYTPEEVKTWEALAAQIAQLTDNIRDLSDGVNMSIRELDERIYGIDMRLDDFGNILTDLDTRVYNCESALGMTGPGYEPEGPQMVSFYIDGSEYYAYYPQSFEEMIMNWNCSLCGTPCPACDGASGPFSHIEIDYENFRIWWNENCCLENGYHVGYLVDTAGNYVTPDTFVYGGEEFFVERV